jgi:SIR2-like protein
MLNLKTAPRTLQRRLKMTNGLEDSKSHVSDEKPPNVSGLIVPEDATARKQMLEERTWSILLRAIKGQRCTPFLGAEVAFGDYPVRSEIAREWATKYGYPLQDAGDLARVAQFIATENDPLFPKDEIINRFKAIQSPDLTNPDEPHRVLADLPLPVYITTNYDDSMMRALGNKYVGDTEVPHKDPRRELCRWNEHILAPRSVFESDFESSVANPVVFHLYGHTEAPQSLVLTEDDYLDFLASVSRDQNLIPARIQQALTLGCLLFLGYRLTDLDFRVLLRSLVSYLKKNRYFSSKAHVSIQVVAVGDTIDQAQTELIEKYLSKYCGRLDIEVGWGTCREFVSELRRRWEDYSKVR